MLPICRTPMRTTAIRKLPICRRNQQSIYSQPDTLLPKLPIPRPCHIKKMPPRSFHPTPLSGMREICHAKIIRRPTSSLSVAVILPICRQAAQNTPYLSQQYSLFVATILPICRTTLLICRRYGLQYVE